MGNKTKGFCEPEHIEDDLMKLKQQGRRKYLSDERLIDLMKQPQVFLNNRKFKFLNDEKEIP